MPKTKSRSAKFKLPTKHAIQKRLYQAFAGSRNSRRDTLLIFGCQRSGTSMFAEAFRNDYNASVYGERGLSDGDDIRLPDLAFVRQRLDADKAGLRVAKPLVESQRAREILDYFPDARAVWMFRNYTDVARSAARRFSAEAPFRNLRPIVDQTIAPDFTAENVTIETRKLVEDFFSRNLNGDSAQALYWYVRNIRYFEQHLERHPRVLLCSYESFMEDPPKRMRVVYDFLGRKFPGPRIVSHIAARSRRNRPPNPALPPDLEAVCDRLLERLRQAESARLG